MTGHPERPLSDLGARGYMSYWTWTIVRVIHEARRISEDEEPLSLSLDKICSQTGIDSADCLATLEYLGLNRWMSTDEKTMIVTDKELNEVYERLHPKRKMLVVDDSKIQYH